MGWTNRVWKPNPTELTLMGWAGTFVQNPILRSPYSYYQHKLKLRSFFSNNSTELKNDWLKWLLFQSSKDIYIRLRTNKVRWLIVFLISKKWLLRSRWKYSSGSSIFYLLTLSSQSRYSSLNHLYRACFFEKWNSIFMISTTYWSTRLIKLQWISNELWKYRLKTLTE
jgi:hypothetical protein